MNDSTLNCDPRLMTEKKSTPKMRANSLHVAKVNTLQASGEMGKAHAVFVTISICSSISRTIDALLA
jgi:hypothetical protein